MKQVKKLLCGVLMVCMVVAGITVVPQNVQAADGDFVIENGLLKEITFKNPNTILDWDRMTQSHNLEQGAFCAGDY